MTICSQNENNKGIYLGILALFTITEKRTIYIFRQCTVSKLPKTRLASQGFFFRIFCRLASKLAVLSDKERITDSRQQH